MSVAIQVQLEGADRLAAVFAGMPARLRSALGRAISKSAFLIEGEAKMKTPRVYDPIGSGPSTGRLVSSINTSINSLSATIGTNVEYAVFVHEGTRHMHARPFMKMGLEAAAGGIQDIVEGEINSAIGSALGNGSVNVFDNPAAMASGVKVSGTTSKFSSLVRNISPRLGAAIDRLTYRPFKGAPRGWQIRVGKAFGIKKWSI